MGHENASEVLNLTRPDVIQEIHEAFLAVEVTVASKGTAETVTIAAPGGGTLRVAAGGTASKRLAGLKPGDYTVTTAGGGKTVLHVVSGGAPGP